MMSAMSDTKLKGFTLLELLVAIAVFAVLAIMSYGALSTVLRVQSQTHEAAEKLTRVQMAILHLERDLMQIVIRPIRDEYGNTRHSVEGDEYGKYRLAFTRTGRTNPMLAPRSYLQRVAYVMPDDEENKLYRYVWSSLDRVDEDDVRKTLLLDDVEELIIRFYDNNGEEQNSWPPPDQQSQNNPRVMPQAIKVVLKLKSMGEIWRLFEVQVN